MNLRDEIYAELKQVKENERFILWQRFKKVRNRCVNFIRRDNKNRLKTEILSKSDSPMSIWKLVDRLNAKDCDTNVTLVEDGREITDEVEAADIFNMHFKTKIELLRKKIDTTNTRDPISALTKKEIKSNFCFKPVLQSHVISKIKALKNKASCAADTISAQVLKVSCSVLSLQLLMRHYERESSLTRGRKPRSYLFSKKGRQWTRIIFAPSHYFPLYLKFSKRSSKSSSLLTLELR